MSEYRFHDNSVVANVSKNTRPQCRIGKESFIANAYKSYDVTFSALRNNELVALRDDIYGEYSVTVEVFGNTRGFCEQYEKSAEELVKRYCDLVAMRMNFSLNQKEALLEQNGKSGQELEDELLILDHSALVGNKYFSFDDDCICKIVASDVYETKHYVNSHSQNKYEIQDTLDSLTNMTKRIW